MEHVGNLLKEWMSIKGIDVKMMASYLKCSTQLVYADTSDKNLSTKKLKRYLPILELDTLADFFELNQKTMQEINEMAEYFRHHSLAGSEKQHLKHEIKLLHEDLKLAERRLADKEELIEQLREMIKDKEALIEILKEDEKHSI